MTFLDPTTLCVAGLMLTLTLLWAYVMLSGRKREQPDLSLLYEPSGSKTGGGSAGTKKASKTKTKKQGISPRASSNPRRVEPQLESTRETVRKRPESKTKDSNRNVSNVGSKAKSRKVKSDPPTQRDKEVVAKEVTIKEQAEGEEGEWQTQLSRQQLRALRQKKLQEGDKTGSSSDSEPKTEKSSSSGEEPVPENSKSKKVLASSVPEKTSYSKGGKRGKGGSKKQRNTAISGGDSQNNATSEAKGEPKVDLPTVPPPPSQASDPPSSDQRVPSSSSSEETEGLTEVEKALKEAALSNSPVPEESKGEHVEVKPKRQKKSRQKDNDTSEESTTPVDIPEDENVSTTVQEHDDWVVIN